MKPWARGGLLATAIALAVVGSVSFGRRLWGTQPALGVSWTPSSVGPIATELEPGGSAERAGLRVGDVLVGVDGQPAQGALREVSLPWAAGERAVRVEVQRGGARLALTLRADLAHQTPDLYGYLSLVGLAFAVSGAFVFWRWPAMRGSGVYAALSAALFTTLVFSHTGAGGPLDWTIFWLDLVAGALVPALLVDLALVLARRGGRARTLARLVAYGGTAALILLALWGVQGNGALRFPDPAAAIQGLDRLQNLFLGCAVAASAAIMGVAYARSRSGLHRGQLRWMLWGLCIGLVPFTLLYVLPWTLGAAVPAWAQFLAVVPLLVVPPFFTAALVRYRLDDLGSILRRGSVEVTAAFCTVAVYAVTVLVLRWLGEGGLLPVTRNVARWVAILPAAIAYPQLRGWVRVAVDRAFFKKRYSYRATLLDFARELNAESDLADLLERLRDRVLATLGLEEARVVVRVDRATFETADGTRVALDQGLLGARTHARLEAGAVPALPWARHLFAMRVKGSLAAVLAVSDRTDGPLTSEDLSLLSTLAAHAGTAIEAARLLRQVRQQVAEVGRLQSRQEKILESSGVGLLLADGDGRILAWNRALEMIYGLPRAEALGRNVADVFPLHLVRGIERQLDAAEEGRLYRQTLVNRRGERRVVHLSISAAGPDREGDGARVVTFDDVTERLQLEEQVSRQERLASLGMLAAGVAHEINTPLTGISSFTQMLLEDTSPADPRHGLLTKIEDQSRRVSGIANALLNLARPERGSFEDLSLNDAVAEVLHWFSPEVRPRKIRVESRLDPAIPILHGHKGKLQQVLLNLLRNAADAVDQDHGGRIEVTTALRDGRVLLEVVDDGVGIREEDLPRIFDPFFTTKGRGKGTGLGLAISYGIVREHEGDMQVESAPGEWTRFRVELPARATARARA
ncbi:MAG TPA: ATP-binding protein [Candidatus Polarisedimenticolaceae bacterium]|nr:ATP-binding protein [Candidatus Polarisedimenticolaceae bacterium]